MNINFTFRETIIFQWELLYIWCLKCYRDISEFTIPIRQVWTRNRCSTWTMASVETQTVWQCVQITQLIPQPNWLLCQRLWWPGSSLVICSTFFYFYILMYATLSATWKKDNAHLIICVLLNPKTPARTVWMVSDPYLNQLYPHTPREITIIIRLQVPNWDEPMCSGLCSDMDSWHVYSALGFREVLGTPDNVLGKNLESESRKKSLLRTKCLHPSWQD